MAAPFLTLDGVERRFADGTQALANINAHITEGSFVSLVGPSGCGKSTLLRLIAGLDAPDGGSITWAGGQPDLFGYVFQDATLMPWATVFDNVWLPHKLRGVSREDAAPDVEQALALVGLADRAGAFPRALSGGMRMRVSIARALSLRPRVLLMDEPFAALDEITRERLNDDLNRLWAEHKWTVIYVTHSVYEATYLSTRVLVMPGKAGPFVADTHIEAAPQRGDTWRADARFVAIAADTTRQLRAASGQPQGATP